jgi:hypothetical protein
LEKGETDPQVVTLFLTYRGFSSTSNLVHIQPVQEKSLSSTGRPSKVLDPAILAEAFHPSRNISVTRLASTLGVSRPTLYKYLDHYNISNAFSNITESELDQLVKVFKSENPTSGSRFVRAQLRLANLHVQKHRVLHSMTKVDSLGLKLRKSQTIQRRVYSVPRPNYLWHMDGHHKLGPWGIVIHGVIDDMIGR